MNADGQLIDSKQVSGVIRSLVTGNFVNEDETSLFVMTMSHDKFRWNFFGFLDADTLAVQKSLDYKKAPGKELKSLMITDIQAADLNEDGRDDLFLGGNIAETSFSFVALTGDFERFMPFLSANNSSTKKEKQRYGHITAVSLQPVRDELFVQYGRMMYVFDLKGKLLHRAGSRQDGFSISDLQLDAENEVVYAVGSVSGGNEVFTYDLTQSNWWAMEKSWTGRMDEVQNNLETLYEQVLDFKPPFYQPKAKEPWVMISGPEASSAVSKLAGNQIIHVKQYTHTEDFDRAEIVAEIGEVANKRDKRKPYKLTREEIVNKARECEKEERPFVIWAGHGTDPFYCSIETLEAVAAAAPETFYGYLYAEMHDPESPRVNYWLDNYLPRLAKACRANGKGKIYFRFKNIFWASNVQMDGWKEAFFEGKYTDVLVPAAEDTTSRTQDINFVGRVGMFAGGSIDDFAFRLIDDNPTSWRPMTPGTQRSVSPYVRNGVLSAAYGARYAVLFGAALEEPGLDLLYALMASGVLPVVERDKMASIGSWHLMQDIDRDWHHSIDDHHQMDRYDVGDDDAVISVAQIQWAGASLPEYDFSRIALGADYRWVNYMPELPTGMVPMGPVDYADTLSEQGIPFSVSDGKVGKVDGMDVPAQEFATTLRATGIAGAKRLPVVVSGAAWAAVWLDKTHLRVTMMDSHYIDPRSGDATLTFPNQQPKKAVDILTKKKFSVRDGSLTLSIPAGSMRFIDITF